MLESFSLPRWEQINRNPRGRANYYLLANRAKSSWTDSQYGDGSQEIIESVENERIKTKLNFEGWKGDNFGIFNLTDNGDQTNRND